MLNGRDMMVGKVGGETTGGSKVAEGVQLEGVTVAE